uniref:Cytochrome P450 n=1 Tax=Haemonchus placei TaxID=6290 RepID=A0A0N4WMZ8_HAEPC
LIDKGIWPQVRKFIVSRLHTSVATKNEEKIAQSGIVNCKHELSPLKSNSYNAFSDFFLKPAIYECKTAKSR